MAGSVDFWTGELAAGYVYYANTMGDVVQSSTLYGREGASGGAAYADQFFYYYDAVSDTILSSDSRIGFATADDTLLLQSS